MIAAGYWMGNFKIRAFSLGPVTGALFAGLLVGHFAHVPVSAMTKSFFIPAVSVRDRTLRPPALCGQLLKR